MSDKNLEEKFKEDFKLIFDSKYAGSAAYRHDLSIYKAGYELAQKEMEDRLKKAREALQAAISAGEFFRRHADCSRPHAFVCKCSFCKDMYSSKNLNDARAYLEKWK